MIYLAILNSDSDDPSAHWKSSYLYVLKSMILFTNIGMKSDFFSSKNVHFLIENEQIQGRLYYGNLFPLSFKLKTI